ncbi:hypothetical protein JTE90_001311 [Oedothorax gibbosus]|uniref:Uncharacterized protein n=1 Tax=Oedothorax gibbosus TaxID=931172 RepID=A0AAV6THY6_9ARAC|nr:hypothetical protein JTE90_001311 [Oedothorax gibbosus]
MDATDRNTQWQAMASNKLSTREDFDKLAKFLRMHVLPEQAPDDEPQAVAVDPVPELPPMETDDELQAVATSPPPTDFKP